VEVSSAQFTIYEERRLTMNSRGEGKTFFNLTENPFVDAGIYAIEAFYEKDFSLLKTKNP